MSSYRTLRFPIRFGRSVHRYRYQLEAFIDKLRGRTPEHWYDAQDSIANMEWIEAIYKEVRWLVSSLAETDKCNFFRLGWDHVLLRRPKCRRNFDKWLTLHRAFCFDYDSEPILSFSFPLFVLPFAQCSSLLPKQATHHILHRMSCNIMALI